MLQTLTEVILKACSACTRLASVMARETKFVKDMVSSFHFQLNNWSSKQSVSYLIKNKNFSWIYLQAKRKLGMASICVIRRTLSKERRPATEQHTPHSYWHANQRKIFHFRHTVSPVKIRRNYKPCWNLERNFERKFERIVQQQNEFWCRSCLRQRTVLCSQNNSVWLEMRTLYIQNESKVKFF